MQTTITRLQDIVHPHQGNAIPLLTRHSTSTSICDIHLSACVYLCDGTMAKLSARQVQGSSAMFCFSTFSALCASSRARPSKANLGEKRVACWLHGPQHGRSAYRARGLSRLPRLLALAIVRAYFKTKRESASCFLHVAVLRLEVVVSAEERFVRGKCAWLLAARGLGFGIVHVHCFQESRDSGTGVDGCGVVETMYRFIGGFVYIDRSAKGDFRCIGGCGVE